MTYTQCRLIKGSIEQVAWIPAEFAKVGEMIRLREAADWDLGWCVAATFSEADEREVQAFETNRRWMKKTSSLAKNH